MILTVERHGNQNTHRMRQRGNMEIKNDLIRKCRHKAEIPFTIFAVVLNVFCGWVLIRLLRIAGNNEWATKLLVDVLKCEEADVVIAIRFGRFMKILQSH